jgi:hypothetical protein
VHLKGSKSIWVGFRGHRCDVHESRRRSHGPHRRTGARQNLERKQEQKHMNHDELEHQWITRLAYDLWQKRGGPIGSPDEDWFRAEDELRRESFVAQLVSAFPMGPIEP